ncbi:MAG: MCE family protein, partial [Acetobacteraceae bacterium]|nr:MCE family protein [Acetobacteraceae bacterium]
MAAAKPAVVGGFILGALALSVAAILLFGGSRLFARTSRVVVFFEGSVAGLEVGAPVTFRGVHVGSVQSVALRFSPSNMTALIPTVLELDPDQAIWEGQRLQDTPAAYKSMIDDGLRAQLALQSFVTGQMRVDLDFVPGTPARLVGAIPGIPEIPSLPSDLEQLRNKITQLPLNELAATALRTLAGVERLAGHVDAALDPLTERADRTADAATQALKTAEEAVQHLQTDASATLRQFHDLALDARGQLQARGGELARTLAAADRVAHEAEVLLVSLNTLAGQRAPFRGNLEATARDLADTASSLRAFARTVER